jgi:hypothetical protein
MSPKHERKDTMRLIIDAALEGPYEWLGLWIRACGHQDNSFLRREFACALRDQEYAYIRRLLGAPFANEHLSNLRQQIITVWGDPDERLL